MEQRRTKVLSVVGPGRSGTTVLGRVLGEVDGVVTAGELRWLWRRGVVEQRPCGCGRPVLACPVWSVVLAEVLGPPPYVHAGRPLAPLAGALAAQPEVTGRARHLNAVRCASTATAGRAAPGGLQAATSTACTVLARVAGAGVVVDTSKRAQDAAVLAAAPDVDHFVLHVVRDPRAVAWSWRRAKPLKLHDRDAVMATRTPVSSALRWTENCLAAEALRRTVPAERWCSTRYEDFVADPERTVLGVLSFLGVDAPSPFTTPDTVVLGTHHTVAGNPDRFRTGEVRIAVDDEWRRRMPWRDQRAVEALTLPLLVRYGYRPGSVPAQRAYAPRASAYARPVRTGR